MALEQDAEGLAKYRNLADNPLYYDNAIQYCGGEFYRAVLGYEVLWDRKVERSLVMTLDYLLTSLKETGAYRLDDVKVQASTKIYGIQWQNGVAPQMLNFDLLWPYRLKAGENLLARVNLVDKPNHVDLERSTGEVFTIPFIRYQNCLNNKIFRRKGPDIVNENARKSAKVHGATKTRSLRLVRKAS